VITPFGGTQLDSSAVEWRPELPSTAAQPKFIQAQPKFIQAQPKFIQAQPKFIQMSRERVRSS